MSTSETFPIHSSARIRVAGASLLTETLEDDTWKCVAQDSALSSIGSGISVAEQAKMYAHALSTGDASGYDYGFVVAAIERGRHNTTERTIALSTMNSSLESAKEIGSQLFTMVWRYDLVYLRNACIDVDSALGWLQPVITTDKERVNE